jgi:tetratricopeptide (TPR) repeat protein
VGLAIPPDLERANPVVEPMLETDALQLQADILLRNGWPDDAAPFLKKALALDPSHRAALTTSARVALIEQRYDDAIRELQAVTAAAPTDFASHYWLAAALADAGRAQEAVTVAARATQLNPRSPEAWLQLSTTALGAGREAQANAAMNLALQLEDNPQWYFARAHRAFETGHYAIITQDVSAYIDGAGLERADYMTFLGALAHRRLNQPDEADRLLTTLASMLVDDTWPAAVTRFLRGQINPSEFLSRAKNNGERTEAHGYIGLMASIAGDRATALEHLRWVRDRGEKNYTEYRLSLAELARIEAPATAGNPSVTGASPSR